MPQQKTKPNGQMDRRGFLKGIGTGAAGAAAVASGTVAATPAEAAESLSERTKSRYRLTDHIKKYYATNRY